MAKRNPIMPGTRFGYLTFIREAPEPRKDAHIQGEFLCDCGTMKITAISWARSGAVRSCGCLRACSTSPITQIEIGQKFGRLMVVADTGISKGIGPRIRRLMRCICDCGIECDVWSSRLLAKVKTSRSCGCYYRNRSDPEQAPYDPITHTKRCGRCKDQKPVALFYLENGMAGRDPYSGYCRTCISGRYKLWSFQNKIPRSLYLRNLRLSNLDEYRLYDAERWMRLEVKQRRREIVAANRSRYRSYFQNRRAREKNANGSFTADEVDRLRFLQKDRCAACQRRLYGKGQLDHIDPLAKGGTNFAWNLQWLCAPCNRRKSDTDPYVYMRRQGFLL